jgi:hypothetical protein
LKKKTPLFYSYKLILFLILVLYSLNGIAQEKDTVLFIPKGKYQNKLIVTKTDSILLLKRRAVLTAKSSKELSDRMAELDAILASYKKQTELNNKKIKSDSIAFVNNAVKKNRKRINTDSLNEVRKKKDDENAKRLARLQASIRKNDSILLVAKIKATNDSIKTAQERIAQNILAKRKQDSIDTSVALQQRARFKVDSTRIAQAKIVADQLAKRKLDSTNTAIANQQRALFKADSTRIAQAKIVADQIAKRKLDSTNTAIANQQRALFKADSTRIAQAKIVADQIAKRKLDSTNTAIANQQRELFKADSTKIAQAKIVADQITKRKLDSTNTAIANQQRALFKADSTRIAQPKIVADQIAKRKLDSTNTAIANQQRALFKADSTRIAQAKIVADQITKRKLDSTNTGIANQQRALFKADSTRVAQAKIVADQIAKRKLDSTNTAIANQQRELFKADSTKIAQAKIIADQIAKRKLDSTNTAIANQQRELFKTDSTRIAQAKIVDDQIAKRKLDSTNTAIANQQRELFKADSIADAVIAEQKAQFKADSTKIAQAKIVADQIAKRKLDSTNTAITNQQRALFKADSTRIATAKILSEQLAKKNQDSISLALQNQQKAQFRSDSIKIAQQKVITDQLEKRRQDSIITAVAKSQIDKINAKNDSTVITNNKPNTDRNLLLNDSINKGKPTVVNSDFIKTKKFLDTLPYLRTGNLLTKFVRSEIDLLQGQIVSNVLKVINVGRKPITFTTDLLIPGGWRRVDDYTKKYVARQNDTIIVPIIISPTKLVNGNTEIIINSFIVGSEHQQLANNYFSLKTRKRVSWDISLSEAQNMYLKNGEEQKRFKFSVNNTGNYKQDLFVNYSIPKKDLFLSDTLGVKIDQPNTTFTLEAGKQKEFDYLVTFKDLNKRNHRRISYNSYDPNKVLDKKVHGLIINSSEPRSSKNSLNKRTKVSFIKLPNEITANAYGYPYIPLTVRLSAQNILSEQSFLALSLRGFKQIDETSSLLYSTDISYTNSYYTSNIFKNAPWYVGYFDDKKTIEIGQISGNLIGVSASGKGVKGSYKINEQHRVGAYYVNSNGFLASNSSIGFGAWHDFKFNENIRIKTQVGRNINSISNRSINVISFQPFLRFNKKHNVSFIGSLSNKSQKNAPTFFKANGLLLGSSYSSSFFKKKLRISSSFRYNDKDFSFGNYNRFYLNNRVSYPVTQKWNAFLSNNYQQSTRYNLFTGAANYDQKSLFNNLVFSTKNKSGSYQPGVFYEYRSYPNSIIHNRGLTFRYSSYNFNKNLINSLYLKAGYTKPTLNNTDNKDYFNFELSSLTRFRTWNFNARYNLGAFSALTSQQALNDFITPQSIRFSVQNQYLFSSRKLLIESNAIYSYNNVFSNHTLGIYPTVYYFNNSGWRFGMSANYSFSTSDFSTVFDTLDNQSGNQFNRTLETTNSNFNLNFSLKKDFGIPIPFVDKTAATTKFVSFLDLNGNGIKENDETTLQNVVVKIGKKEVLTDINGEAVVKNILLNEYAFDAFSLENLQGWFPNVSDKILIQNDDTQYVPFVRGIKVYGDVVLDRQKIAVSDEGPIDLSRIKISATKGEKVFSALTNNSGRFEFYLPYGDYVVTMDEAILNSRLRVTRNNIPLKLKSTQDGVYISFYIIEKRRKVIFTDFTKKKN